MSRIASRAKPALLLPLLACALLVPVAAAQPGVPPPPEPYEPVGPEIPVAADGGTPRLAVFADGAWLAAWRDPDGVTLWARRYGADDLPLGPAFVVGPVTATAAGRLAVLGPDLAIAPLDGERWALAWAEPACDDCPDAVFSSLYDGATPVFERRMLSADPVRSRFGPVLAADGAGRLAVAWTVDNAVPPPWPDGSNFTDSFARIYDFDGDPVSGVFQLNVHQTEEQTVQDATFLAGGDLVFVWNSYVGEGGFYDVYQRLFDADGQALGDEMKVNADESDSVFQYLPQVAPLGAGWIVVWEDWYYAPIAHPDAAFNGTIVGRSYNAQGSPQGAELIVSGVDPPGHRGAPAVAGDGERYVALWEDYCVFDVCNTHPDSPDGSRVGLFATSYGSSLPDNFRRLQVNLQANGDQRSPTVEAAPGGFLAAWTSNRRAGTANGPGPTRVVARRFGEPFCEELCLGGGRFEVEVTWKDFQGHVGRGVPVLRDDGWGTFWFFRPDNVELAVKLLDGRKINGHWWLFYASLSNVEYELTLTDHVDRLDFHLGSYENPSGRFASVGDTLAVPMILPTPLTAASLTAVPLPASATPARPLAPATAATTLAACEADEVCVAGDRFQVEVEWEDFFANSGAGVGLPLTADTAWFWFFRPGNPEMLVKVLDGRPLNGHWWVFYGALTNVGFTLRVTDRLTNRTVSYDNPLGAFASMGDTEAFDG